MLCSLPLKPVGFPKWSTVAPLIPAVASFRSDDDASSHTTSLPAPSAPAPPNLAPFPWGSSSLRNWVNGGASGVCGGQDLGETPGPRARPSPEAPLPPCLPLPPPRRAVLAALPHPPDFTPERVTASDPSRGGATARRGGRQTGPAAHGGGGGPGHRPAPPPREGAGRGVDPRRVDDAMGHPAQACLGPPHGGRGGPSARGEGGRWGAVRQWRESWSGVAAPGEVPVPLGDGGQHPALRPGPAWGAAPRASNFSLGKLWGSLEGESQGLWGGDRLR